VKHTPHREPGSLATLAAVGEAVSRVLGAMEQHQDEIAEIVASALLSEVDGYQLLRAGNLAEEFRVQCIEHMRLFLKMARTGKAPKPEELEFIRQVGLRRADELSPLHALLHGYRVGQRLIWEWVVREAGPTPEGTQASLSLTATLLDYQEIASSVVAGAYMQGRLALETDAELIKRTLLDDLLAGRVAARDRPVSRALAMGLHPGSEYIVVVGVVRQSANPRHAELRTLAEAIVRHTIADTKAPFVVAREDEVVGLIQPEAGRDARIRDHLTEAVAMLRRTRLLQVAVGMSPLCHGFLELARAYDEACRAVEHVDRAGGVMSLVDVPPFEYMLGLADSAAPRVLPGWLGLLLDEDARESGVLLDTLFGYVHADLNVGRTAVRLAVHPNTVQNRLRKIRRVTGLSTRRFGDLLQIVTAVRLAHPDGNGHGGWAGSHLVGSDHVDERNSVHFSGLPGGDT
jgi:PucR C-terminal helix-turn-helix domain/GGDEF-like domain